MGNEIKQYVIINIGCLECGVSSDIVGVFTDREEAEKVSNELSDIHSWREGGQNAFQVFEIPQQKNKIKEDYTKNNLND